MIKRENSNYTVRQTFLALSISEFYCRAGHQKRCGSFVIYTIYRFACMRFSRSAWILSVGVITVPMAVS